MSVRRFICQSFGADSPGATLAEYALLLGGIAVVCFSAVTFLGTQIQSGLWGFAGSI